jgi:hypothetical protein
VLNHQPTIVVSGTFSLLLALILGPGPILAAQDPAKARMDEQTKRESQLRINSGDPASHANPARMRAAMDEIEQHFTRILTLHNDIVRAATGNKQLDYEFVSAATAEIRKHATSLQSILSLKPQGAEADQEKQVEIKDTELCDALIKLCKQIKSFVTNPIIATPGTNDLQESARARRDLESVIQLSGSIRKGAERLSKIPR